MEKSEILNGAKKLRNKYPYFRRGQAVFDYVEMTLGSVAREVQFLDNVDCFYDDSEIDEFVDCVITRLKNKNNEKEYKTI